MASPRQPNRRDRLSLIIDRDGPYCVWCSAMFDDRLNTATTEHLVPRIKGGPSWSENELAACKRCNGERGHQSAVAWMLECEGLGRSTRREIVARAFERLEATILERGGQRRARAYIASQQRRLRNL